LVLRKEQPTKNSPPFEYECYDMGKNSDGLSY
jgi:hypothetical protein